MLNESPFQGLLKTDYATQKDVDDAVIALYEKALQAGQRLDDPNLIQLILMQNLFQAVATVSNKQIMELKNFLKVFFGIEGEIFIPLKQPNKNPESPRAVVIIKVAEQEQYFFFPLPTPQHIQTARNYLAENAKYFPVLLSRNPLHPLEELTLLKFFREQENKDLLSKAVTYGVSLESKVGSNRSQTCVVIWRGGDKMVSLLFRDGHFSPVEENFIEMLKCSLLSEKRADTPEELACVVEAETKAKAQCLEGLTMEARLESICTKPIYDKKEPILVDLKKRLGVSFMGTRLIVKKKDNTQEELDLSFPNTTSPTKQIVISLRRLEGKGFTILIDIYKVGDEFPSKIVSVTQERLVEVSEHNPQTGVPIGITVP